MGTHLSVDSSFWGLILLGTHQPWGLISPGDSSIWGLILLGTRPSGDSSALGTHPSGDSSFWGLILLGTHPSGDSSFRGLILLGAHPSGDSSFWGLISPGDSFIWGLILLGAHPSGDPSFWGLISPGDSSALGTHPSGDPSALGHTCTALVCWLLAFYAQSTGTVTSRRCEQRQFSLRTRGCASPAVSQTGPSRRINCGKTAAITTIGTPSITPPANDPSRAARPLSAGERGRRPQAILGGSCNLICQIADSSALGQHQLNKVPSALSPITVTCTSRKGLLDVVVHFGSQPGRQQTQR